MPEEPSVDPTIQTPQAQPTAPPAPVMPQPPVQPGVIQPTMAQPMNNPQQMPAAYPSYGSSLGGFKKKPSKIALIAAGAVAGLALLIGGIFIVTSQAGVSSDDYVKANNSMSATTSAYSKIATVYIGSSSTQTEITNGVETMKSGVAEFNSEFDKLGKNKAIKNDSDLKAAYKKVDDKRPDFSIAVDVTLEAYEKIYPAILKIDASGSDTATQLATTKSAFAAIDGLKDQNNKDLVSKVIDSLSRAEALAAKVQAGRDNYKNYDREAVSQYNDAVRGISTAIRDWGSNLQKITEKGELKDPLNELSSAIAQKSFKL